MDTSRVVRFVRRAIRRSGDLCIDAEGEFRGDVDESSGCLDVALEVLKCCDVESTFRLAIKSILPSLSVLQATIGPVTFPLSFCPVEILRTVSPAIESCSGDQVSHPCRRQLFAVQTGHP